MDNKKNSFLFYFDNYPLLRDLPPEQRGWVLDVLCTYADRVWRDPSVTMEEVMDSFPLSPQTRVACGFMGATILRDTQRWLGQRQVRQARRQGQGRGPVDSSPAPDQARRDMEQISRMLDRMKSEG